MRSDTIGTLMLPTLSKLGASWIVAVLFFVPSVAAQDNEDSVVPMPGRYLVEYDVVAPDFSVVAEAARRGDRIAFEAATRAIETSVERERAAFERRLTELGARVTDRWWIVEACAVVASPEVIDRVRNEPCVRRVRRDGIATPHSAAILDSTSGTNHATDLVQAAGIYGRSGVLAVLDTGLDAQNARSVRPHRCFFLQGDPRNSSGPGLGGSRLLANRQAGLLPAENALTHGTLVAGVAVGDVWGTAKSDRGHAPQAAVVGYSIVDNAAGGASFSSILNGWQLLTKEYMVYRPKVVLFAYAGSPDPMHPTQIALDRAASTLDVLVTVSAGNGGAASQSSQACVNGIPVGATLGQGQKAVWKSSTRGPLKALPGGYYPLACANGVGVIGPRADAEGVDEIASGTSLAAAQVAGAATWLRALAPQATALQAKALILATLEDVSSKNRTPPYSTRNAFGLGYLREDLLLKAARGGAPVFASASLDKAKRVQVFTFATPADAAWSVVCTWNRQDTTRTSFSDLALEVWSGSTMLVRSDEAQMNVEALRFRAPRAEKLQVRVVAKSLEAAVVPFAIAVAPTTLPYVQGSLSRFGTSCAGSLPAQDVALVVPPSAARTMQSSSSRYFGSNLDQRAQFVVDASVLPRSFEAHGLGLRQDQLAPNPAIRGHSVELEILAGLAANGPAQISSVFAANVKSAQVAFAKRRVLMPDFVRGNFSPSAFVVRFPFDRPFKYVAVAGSHLLVDVRTTGGAGDRVFYNTDAVNAKDAGGKSIATVHAASSTATVGSIYANYGPVMAFLKNSTVRYRLPKYWGVGVPDLAKRFDLAFSDVAPNSAVLGAFGFSRSSWGALPLPFDLNPLGAPTCTLWTGLEFTFVLAAGAFGNGGRSFGLPLNRALIGLEFYSQLGILDPKANRLGLHWSNGIAIRVGG